MNSASHPQPVASKLQAGPGLALIGLIINIAFAIIKIAGGVFGNAYALIADGMESTLDVAGSIVIWGGLRFAARPPDATHPYGHGKAEPLTAIFVACIGLLVAPAPPGENARPLVFPHFQAASVTVLALLLGCLVQETLLFYLL